MTKRRTTVRATYTNRNGAVRTTYCIDCDIYPEIEAVIDGAESLCRRRDCYLRSPLARFRLCERLAAEADRLVIRDDMVTDRMAEALETRT